MKKLIIIIMIGVVINTTAQSGNGGITHFTTGFIIGFTTSTVGYTVLAKKTNLHPTWCKVIAGVSGIIVSNYAGFAWEKYSKGVYNKSDIKHTCQGGWSGVLIGASFTIQSVPMRWVKKNKKVIDELN